MVNVDSSDRGFKVQPSRRPFVFWFPLISKDELSECSQTKGGEATMYLFRVGIMTAYSPKRSKSYYFISESVVLPCKAIIATDRAIGTNTRQLGLHIS